MSMCEYLINVNQMSNLISDGKLLFLFKLFKKLKRNWDRRCIVCHLN